MLLCHRFRGTIDDWDPAFLDVLAAEREVIVFDAAGVGYSAGEVPATVAGMADGVRELLALRTCCTSSFRRPQRAALPGWLRFSACLRPRVRSR